MICLCGHIGCIDCMSQKGNFKCPICSKWTWAGGCVNPDECMTKFTEQSDELDKNYRKEVEHDMAMQEWMMSNRVRGFDISQRMLDWAKAIIGWDDPE